MKRSRKKEGQGARTVIPRATREKLLEAAGQVFAERGYYAATVREICRKGNANVAAVNYHFGNKLGLYTEVLQQSMRAGHVEAIRNALDQNAPPEEIFRAILRARLRGACQADLPNWYFRILAHELAQPTPVLQQFFRKISRPLYERMLELLGRITGLPPAAEKTRLCVNSIMGQILLYALAGPMLAKIWPELKLTPERVDQIADHIADFSLAYLHGLRSQTACAAAKAPPKATEAGNPCPVDVSEQI